LRALELLDLPIACKFECTEIVQPRDRTLAEHFEEFFWDAAVAVSQVKQIGNRPSANFSVTATLSERELRAVR